MLINRTPIIQEQRLGGVDIIGQVNGKYYELCRLLKILGYERINNVYTHPLGRTVIFVGNFVGTNDDDIATHYGVLSLIKKMHSSGNARCLNGYNEFKLFTEMLARNYFYDLEYIDWLQTLKSTLDFQLFTVTSSVNYLDESINATNKPVFIGSSGQMCLCDKTFTFSDKDGIACYRYDNEQTLTNDKLYT